MAKYKNKATNKYYGAGSAGYVSTGSAVTGLSKSLADAGFKLGQANEIRIDRKKDKAIAKIDELYANGKSFETIQSEIIANKHPELTGKYIEATTNYHAGRVKAHETIAQINANRDKYDIEDESTNLNMFYKSYMPDTKAMDSSTLLGFTTQFNKFRAKDVQVDAENRAVISSEKKIREGIGLLDDIPIDSLKTELPEFIKSLQIPVPNGDGLGKPNLLHTNAETLAIVKRSISEIIGTATTADDLDRAEILLNTNLGYSKSGSAIGTLASRKSKEVLVLQEALTKKRRALIINDRQEKEYQDKETVKGLFAKINEQVEVEVSGTADGDVTMGKRDRNHVELMEIRDEIFKMGVPSYITNFDKLMDANAYIDTDPAVYNELVSRIYDGDFSSQKEISDAIADLNIDPKKLSPTLALFASWEKSSSKAGSIHTTNTVYKEGLKYIENAVRGNFTSGGILKENGNQAIRNAHNYMKVELYKFENEYEEKNGTQPSTFEREEFMKKMGDIVIEKFREGDISPVMKTMPEYEKKIKEDEETQKKIDIKYEQAGVPEMQEALNEILSNDSLINKKLIKETLDKFDPSFLGLELIDSDSRFGENDKESKQRFANEQLPTVIANILQNTGFNQAMMEALENVDYKNILTSIASNLGNGVTVEQVDDAMKMLVGRNN